ncbi:MAG: galactokinase [Actinomycetaceae bacterium]|nr:galactokinase [Arcanobacterium sp.]MDD7505317.1 galactokinase [Actinomycetaceae bacterium]MDY6142954.1 galactokinase [Arcanobacterium sp.]
MASIRKALSVQEGIDTARSLFRRAYGYEPEGVWAAPGRVNLIGEHVDYNGGLCLPIALPHQAYNAMARRDDRIVRLIPSQGGDPLWEGTLDAIYPGADIPKWVKYAAGPVWALCQTPEYAAQITTGFDAAIASCVPLGGGLSSSAAMECCVAMGVSDLYGLGLADSREGRTTLAHAGMLAENRVAGAATGGLDQSASMQAIRAHALLLDCLTGGFTQIPFDLQSHGLHLLVIDTMAHHSLNDGQYEQRRATCEAVAAREGVNTLRELPDPDATLSRLTDPIEYARVKHVITEIQRVKDAADALRAGEYEQLGTLFYSSHASLRDDYEVSAPELDVAVDTARSCAALGARMTGGGFGGSAIALVREDDVNSTCEAVTAAFEKRGWTLPQFLDAYAAQGASRVA